VLAAMGMALLCLVSGCTKSPKTVIDSIGMEFRKSWSDSVDSGSPRSFVRRVFDMTITIAA